MIDSGLLYRVLRAATPAFFFLLLVAMATPAAAKTPHSSHRHNLHYHHGHHARSAARSWRSRHARTRQSASRIVGNSNVVANPSSQGFGGSDVVAEARRYVGGNPTGRSRLWCARFMNMVLQRSGHQGTGSDMANSFAHYGQRVSGPQVGAIAVMGRRGGGHVGIVSGVDANGNPIVVSGNHNHRVAEAVYPRGRIYAYVMPSS